MKRDHQRQGQRERGQWQENEDRQFSRDEDWPGRGGGHEHREAFGERQDRQWGGYGDAGRRRGGDDDYTRQLQDRYGHGEGGYNRRAYPQGGYGASGPDQGGFGHGMSGAPVEESREGYYRSHPRLERYDTRELGYGEGRGISTMYQGGDDEPRRTGGGAHGRDASARGDSGPSRSGGYGRDGYGSGGQSRGGGFRGRGPKGYTRSDERITEHLCELLSDDDDVDASEISVEVRDGVATLSGTVEHRWMKHRAEDLAESCSGVKDVENRIRVVRGSQGSGGQSGAGGAASGSSGGSGSREESAAGHVIGGGSGQDARTGAGTGGSQTGNTSTYDETRQRNM